MDLCGCQLEQASYDQAGDFLTSLGWGPGKHLIAAPADRLQELDGDKGLHGDTVWTNLQTLPFIPPVLLWDRKVTSRVPSAWPAIGHWLLEKVGFHFPVFSKLRHARAMRAIAAALSINLDQTLCNIPPATKLLCGVIYGTKANNPSLVADMKRCALRLGSHLLPDTCKIVAKFATEEIDFDQPITLSQTYLREAGADLTLGDRRALLFAKASSTSPSTLTPIVLGGMEEVFSPAAIIEQLVWMSLVQMLHRLYLFYMDPDIAPQDQGDASQSELFGPQSAILGDDRVAPDRARSRTNDDMMLDAGGAESSVSNLTLEDRGKGSIRRQGGPAGRLVLHGADPVYLDERIMSPVSLGSDIYGPAGQEPVVKLPRTGERRLYVPKAYVEEDVDAKNIKQSETSTDESRSDHASASEERSENRQGTSAHHITPRLQALGLGRSSVEGVTSVRAPASVSDERRTVSFSDETRVISLEESETASNDNIDDGHPGTFVYRDEYDRDDDSSSLMDRRVRLADRTRISSRPSSGNSPRAPRGQVVSGGMVFEVERPRHA